MLKSRLLSCCFSSFLAGSIFLPQSATAQEEVPTRVASDEKVMFFPQAANLSADGSSWEAPIHGWIFRGSHTIVDQDMDFISKILCGFSIDCT